MEEVDSLESVSLYKRKRYCPFCPLALQPLPKMDLPTSILRYHQDSPVIYPTLSPPFVLSVVSWLCEPDLHVCYWLLIAGSCSLCFKFNCVFFYHAHFTPSFHRSHHPPFLPLLPLCLLLLDAIFRFVFPPFPSFIVPCLSIIHKPNPPIHIYPHLFI